MLDLTQKESNALTIVRIQTNTKDQVYSKTNKTMKNIKKTMRIAVKIRVWGLESPTVVRAAMT